MGAMGREHRHKASIDNFAEEVVDIWRQDQERPVLYQWLGVVAHSSVVAEEVRKARWDQVIHEIAEVFVWWLSFVSKLARVPEESARGEDLVFYFATTPSEIVWFKFPNTCPVCYAFELSSLCDPDSALLNGPEIESFEVTKAQRDEAYGRAAGMPCRCLSRKRAVEGRTAAFKEFSKRELLKVAREQAAQRPSSLAALEASLERIFRPSIEVLSVEEIAFHLLEEVGEVSEALAELHLQPSSPEAFEEERKRRLRSLGEELADVLSWLITLRAKTHDILDRASEFARMTVVDSYFKEVVAEVLRPASNLADLVWHTYARGDRKDLRCEVCDKRPCDPKDDAHKGKGGELFGQKAIEFQGEILSVKAFPG